MRHRCPYCRSADLRPASPQRTDSWVQRKLSQAYRCRHCGRRSWRLDPTVLSLALAVALVVATPAGFLGWQVLNDAAESSQPMPEDPMVGLTRRANGGDVAAQLELGRRHQDGDGTPTDTSAASRWYGMAAASGDREGQYRYGLAFLEGRGVVQDYRSALDWFQRAAEQNHPKAQRHLGQMYADGRGTPVDTVQAYVWLSLATAQGDEHAARQRDQVLMHLHEDEIGKAQEQARALYARLNAPAPPGPTKAAAVNVSVKDAPAVPAVTGPPEKRMDRPTGGPPP